MKKLIVVLACVLGTMAVTDTGEMFLRYGPRGQTEYWLPLAPPSSSETTTSPVPTGGYIDREQTCRQARDVAQKDPEFVRQLLSIYNIHCDGL